MCFQHLILQCIVSLMCRAPLGLDTKTLVTYMESNTPRLPQVSITLLARDA